MYILSKQVKYTKKNIKKEDIDKILYLKTNFWFGVKRRLVAHVEGVINGFKKQGFKIDYAGVDCSPSLLKYVDNFLKMNIPNHLTFSRSLNLSIFDQLNNKAFKSLPYKNYKFIYHRMALNSLAGILFKVRTGIPSCFGVQWSRSLDSKTLGSLYSLKKSLNRLKMLVYGVPIILLQSLKS